jgi:O-antigen/teichoic acid export membrane protein
MAVLGKAVLYFPAAVTGVLLPLVVTRTVRGQRSLPLLLVSLGAVLALCASLALPLSLFPRALLRLLFGAIYVEHASLLGWYAVAMTLYAVANVWLIYSIGKGHTGFAFGLLVIALAEAVALLTLSLRLQEVVMVILTGGIAAVMWACAEGLITLRNHREEQAPC